MFIRIRAQHWDTALAEYSGEDEDVLLNSGHVACVIFDAGGCARVWLAGVIGPAGVGSESVALLVTDPPSVDRLAELEGRPEA